MSLLGGSEWAETGSSPFGYSVNYNEPKRTDFFNQVTAKPLQTTAGGEPDYFNPVVPLLYPSVQWEVIGLSSDFVVNSLGSGGGKMREKDPTVICQ
jgi:hypothetical protein